MNEYRPSWKEIGLRQFHRGEDDEAAAATDLDEVETRSQVQMCLDDLVSWH